MFTRRRLKKRKEKSCRSPNGQNKGLAHVGKKGSKKEKRPGEVIVTVLASYSNHYKEKGRPSIRNKRAC